MKVVLLAGGFGTRISEESEYRPKPMIEIGNMPILWHIMKLYAYYGHHEFIICAGYKQHIIKEWFADYYLHNSDITFHLGDNTMEVHNSYTEPWMVTVVDTGMNTMTGGRIKRIQKYVGDEPFFLSYGDGVSDVNLDALLEFHQSHGKKATLTAVNVGQRFGVLGMGTDNCIEEFREKAANDENVINGGFMVLEPDVFQYIEGDSTVFEKQPLEHLAAEKQLMAYMHTGFWKCMDTQRDWKELSQLWEGGHAPWKVW